MTDRLRILLVEDSDDDELLVRRELTRNGLDYEMKRVESHDEMLAALRAERFDIVLSDYSLPSFGAEDALEVVRASGTDIPFIIVSGSVGEDIAVRAMRAGAADYFRKENIMRLVPAIQREVTEKRQRDDKRRLEAQLAMMLETERSLREDAERANRVKDEFLAMLSHELRTPLNAVIGRVHMLRNSTLPEAARDRALETIERNAQAQAQVVDDLLDISRLASGRLTLDCTDVDLTGIVHDTVAGLAASAEASEVTIDEQSDGHHVHVTGDAARLRQVAWNLIANAVKFTPAGGRVVVSVGQRAGLGELVVADNGPGISSDALPRVFERFYQADASTTRRSGGLGLGLAITRELVELHGGEIIVENTNPGARFRVLIPQVASVPTPTDGPRSAPVPAPTANKLEGLRVLLVEDDNDAREMLSDLLVDYGAEVHAAPEARTALDLAARYPADVIISDIGMPEMDGYELLGELRRRGVTIPAIALTAYASSEDRRRAQAAGFAVHMSKPLSVANLLHELRRLAG